MSDSTNNPCVLLINDIHASHDTIDEFTSNWNEALEVCRQHDIPRIVVGGDLWQARAHQTLDVLLAVRSAILRATKEYKLDLVIAEGNHDLVDQEAMEGYSHLFSEYENVYVVDDFAYLPLGDKAELCVMSYFPENGSFCKRLEEAEAAKTPGAYTILYAHQGINGALATPNETDLPTKIFKGFDKVLVGHYHDRCVIPGTNIEYIGGSRQHNFGETPDKGYTIVYEDGSYQFVQNNANARFATVEVAASELTEERINEILSDRTRKVKLKISCSSEEAATLNKQDLLVAGVAKIEVNTEQTVVVSENHDFDTKFDKNGIKQEYVKFCDTKDVSAEMGLEYLEKIGNVCGN